MDLEIAGRHALVLGGGKGLGRGIAEALAQEGVRLSLASRDRDRLAAAAAEIRARTNAPVEQFAVDLAVANSVDELARAVGEVDILVLNGGGPPAGPVTEVAAQTWRSQFESLVVSPIRLANAFLPGMRARCFGRILVVLSSGVVQPLPNLGISNSLRLALLGWMKTLASEVAADGVTVNGLAPGRIHTDRVDELDRAAAARQEKTLEQIRSASRASIPLNRYGEVAEFAAAAAFIASKRASYITGSLLRVDGGLIRAI